MEVPPPPSITPRQMNLLRVVTSMAWSDGELATEEVDVMLNQFSRLFAKQEQQQQQLQQELRDYLMQNIPLEELIPKLETQAERELVLVLGYEVINSSARTPDEPKINPDEAAAYQTLLQLLNLPSDVVQRLEEQMDSPSHSKAELIETITRKLGAFIQK
ncbi:conserved hypothetical protein [Planktothrix serta PCC 8927]|uniref:Branched-chain amino acid ABC transporter ATP-binding protein n=1 Tax=Planktothrix serta PCC 8927 TaxID=671068 RepID=A0A7Z9DZB2_9CYAN|nr:TerB family tellurite resistance protein [Planktothrix serta]VXD17335.1 conserved hypothetical protein [Planktothrix serta PCC 8927]